MDTYTFVGIDVNSRSPHYHLVAIDDKLQCTSDLTGNWKDLSSCLMPLDNIIIAINAPLSLNTGFLTDSNVPKTHPGRWPNCRRMEYELAQHGVPVYFTPNDPRKMPSSLAHGFTLSLRLIDLGYQPFSDQSSKSVIEVPAEAAFWSIVRGDMLDQNQLLGRIQRQMILYELGFDLPDPMEFFEEITRFKLKMGSIPLDLVLSPQPLNARMAAYTARQLLKDTERVVKLGYQQEGYLYLPADPFEQKQS